MILGPFGQSSLLCRPNEKPEKACIGSTEYLGLGGCFRETSSDQPNLTLDTPTLLKLSGTVSITHAAGSLRQSQPGINKQSRITINLTPEPRGIVGSDVFELLPGWDLPWTWCLDVSCDIRIV